MHRHALPLPHRSRGFTLIELMITVAIVAILASIAYPAYTDSILKGRRAEGRTALTELLQQQERYNTQRNTYLIFSNNNGTTSPASPNASQIFKVFSGNSATGTSYWLQAVRCPAPNADERSCVEVQAVPTFTDTAAGTLWMRSTGEKGCNNAAKPALCWK